VSLGQHVAEARNQLRVSEHMSHSHYELALVSSSSSTRIRYSLSDTSIQVDAPSTMPHDTLVESMSDVLAQLLTSPTQHANSLRIVQFAPRYRLSFSLMNEDAAPGSDAITWDVEDAVRRTCVIEIILGLR
jgi:phosphatidylinositol glycan class S